MQVYLSVDKTCKFCDWEITDNQKPMFLNKEDGEVFAFCPVCQFELEINRQETESKFPSDFYARCEEKHKNILDQKG